MALKKILSPRGMIKYAEIDIVAVRSIISAWRFREGGIAMLAPIIRNQSIVSCGASVSVPFVRKILRVWVDWYDVFARAKSPDDASPWAIIIVKAACHPHVVFDMMPANRGPICVTEL